MDPYSPTKCSLPVVGIRLDGQTVINSEPLATIAASEIPDHPEGTDDNALYAFKAGGMWFAHMGDLGIDLSDTALETFRGKCDVLLAITGEQYMPKSPELDRIFEFLKPTWIFPCTMACLRWPERMVAA